MPNKLNKGTVEGVFEPPGEPIKPKPEAPKRKAKENVSSVKLPFLMIRRASKDGKTEGKCWYCGDPTPFKDLYLIDWHPKILDHAICRSICLSCFLNLLCLPKYEEGE